MNTQTNNRGNNHSGLTLVLGGTGKTGQRIADRLTQLRVPIRIASRSTSPGFDWNDPSSWDAILAGVTVAYISYSPDLAVPGATDTIRAFVDTAVAKGVQRLVLLSGRGEAEAQRCEQIVLDAGVTATIVRASWFNQNFSEGEFVEMVLAGEITLPAGDIPEPFIDVDDIADVAVATLTEDGHNGEIYELTGPRLLTFATAAQEISAATGREVRYTQIPAAAFTSGLSEAGLPDDVIWLMDYLFSTVLDGRNASLHDGVQRVLGREPKDFATFASEIAASGLWASATAKTAAA